MATWQYDPLTGKNKIFKKDDFYFFGLNDCMDGKISDFESTITNPRMRWR